MAIDKNLPPITVDNQIDDDGGNLWSLELNSGTQANRAEIKLDGDESYDTLSLDDPSHLGEGLAFKVAALGPELSKTIYDNRHRARCVLFTRSYNSPDSDRFNSLITGDFKTPGTFQRKTYHEILKDICKYLTENFPAQYHLQYDDSNAVQLPSNYAGEIRFENTDVVSAINQIVEKAGGFSWTLDLKPGVPSAGFSASSSDDLFESRIKIVDFSNPGVDRNYGVLGVNITSADFTGSDECGPSGVMVVDKEGRGLKIQFGGPDWFGAVGTPGEETVRPGVQSTNSIPPLHLTIGSMTLDQLDDPAAYDMNNYGIEGLTGYKTGGYFKIPTDESGNFIDEIVVLSLNGGTHRGAELETQLNPDNSEFVNGFNSLNSGLPLAADTSNIANVPTGFSNGSGGVRLFGFDQKLLTHPSVQIAPEAYSCDPPTLLMSALIHVGNSTSEAQSALNAELNSSAVQSIITEAQNSGYYREIRTITGTFSSAEGKFSAIAFIVCLHKPQWSPITGLKVDLRKGLVYLPRGSIIRFGDWCSNPQLSINYDSGKPKLVINHTLVDAITNNPKCLRLHCVLSGAIDPKIRGEKPFHLVKKEDFRVHNVPFNIDGDDLDYEIETSARNDLALMEAYADSLFTEDFFNSSSKGSLNIYPGHHTIKVGQLTNGGVIISIRHDYIPYFKSTIKLVQDSGFTSLDGFFERRRINDLANRSEISPDSILKKLNDSAISQSIGEGASASYVPPHTHSANFDGGSRLGHITVESITVLGTRSVPNGGVDDTGGSSLKAATLIENATNRGYVDWRYDPASGTFFTQSPWKVDRKPDEKRQDAQGNDLDVDKNESTPISEVTTGQGGYPHNFIDTVETNDKVKDLPENVTSLFRMGLAIYPDWWSLRLVPGLKRKNFGGDQLVITDGQYRPGFLGAYVSSPISLFSTVLEHELDPNKPSYEIDQNLLNEVAASVHGVVVPQDIDAMKKGPPATKVGDLVTIFGYSGMFAETTNPLSAQPTWILNIDPNDGTPGDIAFTNVYPTSYSPNSFKWFGALKRSETEKFGSKMGDVSVEDGHRNQADITALVRGNRYRADALHVPYYDEFFSSTHHDTLLSDDDFGSIRSLSQIGSLKVGDNSRTSILEQRADKKNKRVANRSQTWGREIGDALAYNFIGVSESQNREDTSYDRVMASSDFGLTDLFLGSAPTPSTQKGAWFNTHVGDAFTEDSGRDNTRVPWITPDEDVTSLFDEPKRRAGFAGAAYLPENGETRSVQYAYWNSNRAAYVACESYKGEFGYKVGWNMDPGGVSGNTESHPAARLKFEFPQASGDFVELQHIHASNEIDIDLLIDQLNFPNSSDYRRANFKVSPHSFAFSGFNTNPTTTQFTFGGEIANVIQAGVTSDQSSGGGLAGQNYVGKKFWVAEWAMTARSDQIAAALQQIASQLPASDSNSVNFSGTAAAPLNFYAISFADAGLTNENLAGLLDSVQAIANAFASINFPQTGPFNPIQGTGDLQNDINSLFAGLFDALSIMSDIASQLDSLGDDVAALEAQLEGIESDLADLAAEIEKLKKNKKGKEGVGIGEGPGPAGADGGAPDATPAGPADTGTTPTTPAPPSGAGSPPDGFPSGGKPGGEGTSGPGSVDGGPGGGSGGKASDNKEAATGLGDNPIGGNDNVLGSAGPGAGAGGSIGGSGSGNGGSGNWMGQPGYFGGTPHPDPLEEPDNYDYLFAGNGGLNPGSQFNPDQYNPTTLPINMPKISQETAREIWSIGGGGGYAAGLIGVSTDVGLTQPDPNGVNFDVDNDVRNPFIWASRTPTLEMDATGRLVFVGGGHIFPTMINSAGQLAISDDESAAVNIGGMQGFSLGLLAGIAGIDFKPNRIIGSKAFGMMGVINDGSETPVIVNSYGVFHAVLDEDGRWKYADNSEVVLGGQIRKIRNQIDRYAGNVVAEDPDLFSATGNIVGETHTLVEAIIAMDQNSPKNNYSATSDPTANDDNDDGYEIGSIWTNSTDDSTFICIDSTVSAAVWHRLSGFTANRVPFSNSAKGLAESSSLTYSDSSKRLTVGSLTQGNLAGDVVYVAHNTPFTASALRYALAIENSSNLSRVGINASSTQYVNINFDGGTGAGGGSSHTAYQFTESQLKFFERTAGSTDYVGLRAAASGVTSYDLTLPTDVGAKNTAPVASDGTGTLEFKNPRKCDDIQTEQNSYSIEVTDGVIGCDTSSDASLDLPEVASYGYGIPLWIKDTTGTAGTHPITITRASTDTIDGSTSITLSSNYGAVCLMGINEGEWSVMFAYGTLS